jgi:hypothetical protein
MALSKDELSCPFCGTALPARASVCSGCSARKHTKKGMSPTSFRLYVSTWLLLTLPVMLCALMVGLAPWAPGGTPPAYALAAIGAAHSVQDLTRCRVEVVDAAGRKVEQVIDGACAGSAAAKAGQAASPQPSMTTRRMAAAVHTSVALLLGVLASWLLQLGLRLLFLRRSAPSWVRRATAG